MKNKFKSVAIAAVLGIVGIFAGLGLSGCGGSLSALKSDYAAMEKAIANYTVSETNPDTVFSEDVIDNIKTKLKVNYGAKAESKLTAVNPDYLDELKNEYNSILVISNDYIVQNIEVIKNYNQKKLSKSAKSAVKALCSDIKDFTKYLKTFATARKGFSSYFDTVPTATKADIESKLVLFKKSYGTLVSKNIDIAMSVAKCMERTEIYESLKKTSVDGNTLKIIRDYARTKMLPIFSKFMLAETSNQMIWDNYKNKSDSLRQIDSLLESAKTTYSSSFKNSLVSTATPTNTSANVKDLFDMVDEFLKEADCYLNALEDLDIREFAVTYDGNMEKYLKSNKLAERELYKVDQFLKITLPNFITNFSNTLR